MLICSMILAKATCRAATFHSHVRQPKKQIYRPSLLIIFRDPGGLILSPRGAGKVRRTALFLFSLSQFLCLCLLIEPNRRTNRLPLHQGTSHEKNSNKKRALQKALLRASDAGKFFGNTPADLSARWCQMLKAST